MDSFFAMIMDFGRTPSRALIDLQILWDPTLLGDIGRMLSSDEEFLMTGKGLGSLLPWRKSESDRVGDRSGLPPKLSY